MNPIRHVRRALAVLAGMTAAVLACGAAPAFALESRCRRADRSVTSPRSPSQW